MLARFVTCVNMYAWFGTTQKTTFKGYNMNKLIRLDSFLGNAIEKLLPVSISESLECYVYFKGESMPVVVIMEHKLMEKYNDVYSFNKNPILSRDIHKVVKEEHGELREFFDSIAGAIFEGYKMLDLECFSYVGFEFRPSLY